MALQQGVQQSLEMGRAALLRGIESHFGRVPEEVRKRVEAINSIEELTAFGLRVGSVSSVDDLAR